MSVDPNVYALSISLQLDSSDAFKTLAEFGVMASNIEENISSAAQSSLNSITGIVDNLNEQLASSVAMTGQFAAASSKLELHLSQAAASLKDAHSTQQDSLADLEERLVNLEKIKSLQEDLEKSVKSEHKTGGEFLNLIIRWISALENKNLVHGVEADMIKAEHKLLQNLTGETQKVKKNLKGSVDVMGRLEKATLTVWALIKNFDKETENFVTANYRVYGSQQQIVNSTRELSAEFGVFRQEALATYKALADVKTPRDEIYKLAGTVGRANRITGVGIETLANYSFQLRGAGFNAARTRKQIDMMSAAQRAFGLSTYDVQKAIESQTLSAAEQVLFFGKDAPEAFMKASLGLRALDKELGTNSADDMMQRLQKTGVDSIVFWDTFGMDAGEAIAEPMMAQARIAERIASEVGLTLDEIAAGGLHADQMAEITETAKAFDVTSQMVIAGAKAHAELNDEQKKQLTTMAGVEKAMEAQIAANKRWAETMDTLTAQLAQLKSTINALVGYFFQLIADALLPFLKVLNWIIGVISTLIGWVRSIIGWMEKWIPGFHLLMNVIRFAVGLLIGFIAIIVTAGIALASFGFAFGSVSNIVQGGLDIITGVADAIVAITEAIGESIRVIFVGLGQGLAALGNSVRPVIIPLMQLGVAVLLVGAGFWLMGMGMAAAAEHGLAAVAVLAAMTVAMITMLTTFAIIATVAGPAIPLMLALAAVVLILGAAALLAGAGMYLMGMSIEQIGMYGPAAASALPLIAIGILAVGAAGWLGSAGVVMAAGALMILGVALWLIAIPLAMISSAIEGLTGESLTKFADALLASAWKISLAFIILIPALILLPYIAAGLLYAGVVLIAAGALFAVASIMIGFGAKLLGEGMSAIAAGAKDFTGVDFIWLAWQLLAGGLLLLLAGVPFVIGATLVGAAALLLGKGLYSLGEGAQQLEGIDFIAMAGQLLAGGLLLLLAGVPFVIGATLVGAAALLLGKGLYSLGEGAQQLEGIDFIAMAGQLFWGGLWLIAAAIPFTVGATLVGAAALLLGLGLYVLGKGAQQLEGIDFAAMAEQLFWGGLWLIAAAIPFTVGATLVGAAALLLGLGLYVLGKGAQQLEGIDFAAMAAQLRDGASNLVVAGDAMVLAAPSLIRGAIGIYIGMMWLEMTAKRFEKSADNISKMGKGISEFARAFYILSGAPVESIGVAVDSALEAMPGIHKLASELGKSASEIGKGMSEFAQAFHILSGVSVSVGSIGTATDSALAAMPGINKLADELDKSASKFQAASDKFVKPVTEIANSLEHLGMAMANISQQGLTIQTDLDKLGGMLDKYTTLLESTAARIEIAVVAKAQPAMATARSEGLEDAVRSEAITTVQVMNKTEGEARQIDNAGLDAQEQTAFLRNISEKVDVMTGGGGTELTTIVELLETYLPGITGKEEGLSTEFNQWMK